MGTGAPASQSAIATVDSNVRTLTDDLAAAERRLWALAVATAILDVYLTYEGLQSGLSEGNPLVASLIENAGILALAGTKGVLLSIAGLVRLRIPAWGPWLPLGLALPWLVAAGINATLIVLH